jgi:hypothetical protein
MTLAVNESVKGVAPALEAPVTCAEKDSETHRECKDLRAQQEMAHWALWMTVMTGLSAVVGAVAAVLIYKTFHQTRTSAEKQLRAYLNVFEISADWKIDEGFGQHRSSISIQVKNTGQTPAHAVRSWMGYVSSNKEPEHFGEVEGKSPGVFAAGKIAYVDVFNHPRETSFRYVMPLDGVGESSGRFRPCEKGNEAT